jgi:3-deoxy-D-arabino-heptulosonate 7-phosphate (DAHP) synthase
MDAAGAESTQDWLLPERSRPPTVAELERRIEVALVAARASEAAVMTVGAAAFDAAEQARRAAELAERASAAVALATSDRPRTAPTAEAEGEGEGEGLRDFSERADRLVARLRQLQRIPLAEPAASDVSDR